ncbi:thermonuclease family protein [Erysipelothrix rhusiopathiae]|uniref:Nuclease-like protein n=2 Tax=Erysipelothrix rhusiopathiae TaxID=1648 RepID=E7FW17_ERYRH|nr:thermonuclease family protein [Erysipelothrix rhusiopathiae]EFY09087.1 nuclease-like protein [Erysipelothrix rhusiopathiae ATCC 19414]MDE8256436.1 thermonuclease family protein [Erysipelothrix rhusiopathiae]MDV7679722.1 thermonuclease family protein [Erysipelothrix rhusiopathiae]VEH83576.1 Thermonuclease precursor [Erysipelothrix rhusiopathiae]
MNNKIKQNTANMLLKITLLVVLVIIFLLSEFAKPHNNSNMEHVTLHKCIDGDTAQLNIGGKKEKVRFIAVDTPELRQNDQYNPQFFAEEASSFTCEHLKNAKKIELEYDPEANKYDKYGRVIAWVYVDDALLQELLVSGGFAKVKYIYGDYLYVDKLNGLQAHAKKQKVGIWK